MLTETETPAGSITPTFADVSALVLTSCFGWRWERRRHIAQVLTALIAPQDDPFGYSPTNYDPHAWEPSDANARRFSNWDTANIRYLGDHRSTTTLPNFCRDRNLVAERLLPLVVKAGWEADFGVKVDNILEIPIITHTNWGHEVVNWPVILEILQLPPAILTEAILRTLNHWPATWGQVGTEEGEA